MAFAKPVLSCNRHTRLGQHPALLIPNTLHTVRSRQLPQTSTRSVKVSAVMATEASPPPTSSVSARDRIDGTLQRLQAKKQEWAELPLARKIQLLKDIRARLPVNIMSWGKAGASIRGLDNSSHDVALEALNSVVGPAMYINKLIATYESLERTGKCPSLTSRDLPGGQKAVTVWPVTPGDKQLVLLPGVSAELYLQPGVSEVTQTPPFMKPNYKPKLCVVLGAGNHGFLSTKDVLYALFERGEVAALKPHPIMMPWQPYHDEALAPLVEAGFYATIPCDSLEESQQLIYSPLVDCVHMTGGTATHDAIVWGATPEEQARRKAADDPLLTVPMTSELGCITPCIITGGKWTEKELTVQAQQVAFAVAFNNSCNCNAVKVIILPDDWPQADIFLAKLKETLRNNPLPPPYYPGIHDRYAAWKARYPNAEEINAPAHPSTKPLGPALPYLINELKALPEDPSKEYAFQVEPFAPVVTVLRLPTKGAKEFLEKAVEFANDKLWGTLSCTIVLHPDLEKEFSEETQKAVQDLRYGCVAVNSYSGTCVIIGTTTWGAFVGNQTVKDVGSGIGIVGNSYFVDGIQKTVYRIPIDGIAAPKPGSVMSMPLGVAKAFGGFMCGGWLGMLKALVWSK